MMASISLEEESLSGYSILVYQEAKVIRNFHVLLERAIPSIVIW